MTDHHSYTLFKLCGNENFVCVSCFHLWYFVDVLLYYSKRKKIYCMDYCLSPTVTSNFRGLKGYCL
jgi:hypothetical protein